MGKSYAIALVILLAGCAQGVPSESELGTSPGPGPDAGTEETSCVCSIGECCDGCNLLPATTACGSAALAVEYQCESASCGGDAMVREQWQHCDGATPVCPTNNPVWGDWQVAEDCDGDALCQSDGQSASCQTCSSGCQGDACVCTQGANVAPSATPSISRGSSDQNTYGPGNLNDGSGEAGCGFAWFYDQSPDVGWMELEWTSAVELYGFTVDTVSTTSAPCLYTGDRTLAAGTIEWWDGSAWVSEDAFAGQTGDWSYTFASPITTTRLRINQALANPSVNPVVFEWQAFECAP